jgi:periplasmic divalent cation tolerance protein
MRDMKNKKGYCIVLSTCSGDDEAGKLAESIVRDRLAACVQVMPIQSFYEWKGELHKDEERLLIMKTKCSSYRQLEEFILQHHSYDVPEIVQVPIESGFRKYFEWIDSITG